MEENIYGEYEEICRAGSGAYGQVFVGKKINDVAKKAYIIKALRGNKRTPKNILALQKEIDSLKKLNIIPRNEHIPFLYASDKYNFPKEEKKKDEKNKNNIIINGEINDNENIKKSRPYYVIDYFSKGNLFYYIENSKNGFGEKYARVIFKKILDGIKFCHDRNLCHLDIKPANIVLDKNFEIIIIDFGSATKCKDEKDKIIPLKILKGTENYMGPEMWENPPYNGIKADIFSLGVIAFNLVTGKHSFQDNSKKTDPIYNLILNDTDGTYKEYWDKINKHIKVQLSDNFKNLYISMIAHNPKDRPDDIDEILSSAWMNEFNNLNPEERKKLEQEVINQFGEIYQAIEDKNREIKLANSIIHENYITRGITYEKGMSVKTPKKIPNDRININHYIIIDGALSSNEFMNSLIKDIKSKFGKLNIFIRNFEEYEHLKFELGFLDLEAKDEDEKGEEEEEEDEDKDIKCKMEIELFQYEDGRYLLEFLRTKGEIRDYYNNFLEIRKIIEEETLKSNIK